MDKGLLYKSVGPNDRKNNAFGTLFCLYKALSKTSISLLIRNVSHSQLIMPGIQQGIRRGGVLCPPNQFYFSHLYCFNQII